MEQTFTIQGRFCSLNEIYRLHHYAQGKTKAEHEARVIDEFVEATTVPEFLNVDTILETGEPDIKYNIVS